MTALQVQGISKRFGGLKAVDGLSLRVDEGRVLGLLGPNGSGKSTALNLISGVLQPDAGSVKLYGREVAGMPSFKLARRGIARTFQLVRVFGSMQVQENVAAGMAFAGASVSGPGSRTRIAALLAQVGLDGRGAERAGSLNYIDQKRLELARALAANPRVLLLDEWLAGLNPTELAQAMRLVQSVQRDGIAIILVEHVLEAVRTLCDHCVVMNAGRQIAAGSASEALAHPDVITAYLGDDDA